MSESALKLALGGPHSPESTEPAAAQAVPTEASAGAAPGPSLPRCGFCRKEYDPARDNDPIARLRKATKGAFDRCSGACGGMPWLDTPPPADYAGLSAEERMAVELRESLESADVESIADLHAQAQATIEGLSEQMRPHQIAANVTRQLLFERLLARGGRKLLHDALDIEMKPKTETVITDEDAIQELLTVKIDGKPIPADLLDPAIRFEEVPATTKLRTNLTHIKTLVKDIGGAVRDIFDRATITRTSYVMTIKPKPKAKA